MGTLYVSQAAAGYNASPPPDDGTQVASNQITWGTTIKAKIGDPIKTLADAINSQLTTVLDLSPRAISTNDSAVASDHWRTLQVTGTTTITLSDAATMTNKYVVGIANLGVATVTVTRATAGNTINGTAADFTLAPKQAVMLGVNQGATGYNILAHSLASGAGINTIQATTSVVTPLVASATGITLGLGVVTQKWGIDGTTFALFPASTFDLGKPSQVITNVFASTIDSGTTGSLSLKTNNGNLGFTLDHVGGAANSFAIQPAATGNPPILYSKGDANISHLYITKGTGGHTFYTGSTADVPTASVVQFQVTHTASATRNVTITGSNGGNPTISTTAGSLAITPDIVAASTISIGTTPALGGTLRLPYTNTAIETRDADNTTNLVVLGVATVNSVKNITTFGNLSTSSAGVIFVRRSAAGAPTTSDIPDGCWTLWRDTSGATTKLFYNNGGSLQSVALV